MILLLASPVSTWWSEVHCSSSRLLFCFVFYLFIYFGGGFCPLLDSLKKNNSNLCIATFYAETSKNMILRESRGSLEGPRGPVEGSRGLYCGYNWVPTQSAM